MNGSCQGGINNNGQTCNDNNSATINDIYTNGVCAGTMLTNGQACNDGNPGTSYDIYNNGICAGTLNGTCPILNRPTCNDGNTATVNDILLNGVCRGSTVIAGFNSYLGAEATFTVNNQNSYFNNATALFDKVNGAYHYFHSYNTHYLDITVTTSFKIWSFNNTNGYDIYDGSLIFTNLDTGVVAQNTVLDPQGIVGSWKLISSVIPAGRYRITIADDVKYGPCQINTRTDVELFI